MPLCSRPIEGVGLGLRLEHYAHILSATPALPIPWFEVLADNYFGQSYLPLKHLEKIRALYPVTFHSIGLSLGSTDPLSIDYLKALKQLGDRFEPAWYSEHLSWCSVGGEYVPDLLPVPYTQEALEHIVSRVHQVQEFLGAPLVLENPSRYLAWEGDEMPEWAFIQALINQTGCYLLLDLNNLYVSAQNLTFDPLEYLRRLPINSIKQIHLAGFSDKGTHLFDDHSQAVHPPVWDLYAKAIARFGLVPTLLEWDTNIPELSILMEQARKAEDYGKIAHTAATVHASAYEAKQAT